MRRPVGITAGVIGAALIATVAVSCDDSTGPDGDEYVAILSPANEVPVKTTPGTGVVTFEDKGTHIEWTMTLTNMTDVIASHIHGPAPAGTNTGIMIFLWTPTTPPPTGTISGVVAEGTITNASNANVSVDSLRTLFNNGMAYVNVHTAVNPGGEIRDQIRPTN